MTVYSINKNVLDQANMTAAQSKAPASAVDQFTAALSHATSRFGLQAGSAPSAEKAMKAKFDKPVEETRPAKQAEKPERAESKTPERETRRADHAKADRADKSQPRDDAGRKEQGRVETVDQGEAAPEAKAAQPVEDNVETVTDPTAQQTQQATPEAQAAAVQTNTQQNTQAAQDMSGALVEGEAEATDQDPFAWLNKQAQSGQADAADADAGAEQAAADQGADFTLDAAQTAAAATKSAGQTAQKGQAEAGDLAAQQAQQMARDLDDTGAQLDIQVSVQNAAAKDAGKAQATEAASALDILLAQDVGAGLDGDVLAPVTGNSANGQNGGQNQGQNQGTGNAAQQLAANAALQNAMAANGKAAEAKPFAAALAAQAEAANAPQAANGAAPQNQSVGGIGGTSATQAASKPAPTQQAHAPRQPPATPEQVMDQVKVQIAKHGQDGDTIKIQLKPVEMGAIEVKLELGADGRVTGTVTADNKETLAILQKDARGLEKALDDAGFKTDAGSLSFNLREGAREGGAQDQGQARPRRSRLSAAMAQGVDASTATQAQARLGGGRSGVDIKV